jgi:hypothetical protein
MHELVYESITAFVTFALVRYTLPNIVLQLPIDLWKAFVLSTCYALCAYIRKYVSVHFIKKK